MERMTNTADAAVQEIVGSIEKRPIASIVTDNRKGDNPIVAANEAFLQLTGYSREEILGRNCRFLAGHATEREASAALRDAVAQGKPAVVELTNYRKDGSAFRNAVMIAPVLDGRGVPILFVGSQMDVTGTGSGLRQKRARELLASLSARQKQVLRLMSGGYRNKQIASELGIDEKTVKMHRARLIRSLGVNGSADAIRIAIEGDFLISDPD